MIAQRLSARRLHQLLGQWRGDGHSYHELSESIVLLVRDGGIPSGSVLPAERPLAEELRVSRTTVAAAYQRLRETGAAVSRRGSGTVIRARRPAAESEWDPAATGEVDLCRAAPTPWSGLPALGQRALAEHASAFQLEGYDTIGHPALRSAIAERYTRRGLPTDPTEIMVTLGAQHAIFLIARALLRRGDRSLIESPSYPRAREALAAAGALIGELPVGRSGYDAAGMLRIAATTAPRLSYLIPDQHNPTGLSMSPELRAQLIATLTAQGGYVIADETTAELALGHPGLVTPFAVSAPHAHQRDMILTVGSLGKTVWGGLRVGWVRATPDLIAQLESARRVGDLGTGTWEQVMATLALEEYEDILAARSSELSASHRVLLAEVQARFPGWRLSQAAGGVSVWADLGEACSSRLSRSAAQLGLILPPGPRFGSPGVFEQYLRVPFTLPVAELAPAMALLEQAWDGRGNARPGPVDRDSPVI